MIIEAFPSVVVTANGNVSVQGSVGSIVFANSNGITFGGNTNSVITASHNGLTTAAQVSHSHGAAVLNLTSITGGITSNSAGLTIDLSGGGGGPGGGIVLGVAGSTVTNGTVVFSNSNGVSFGLNGSTVTAAHNGLTTAAASNHSHSLNEIDNPSADKVFLMNTRQLQFQWGTNLTGFTTATNKVGLFEIDIIGGTNFATNPADNIDILHIHQNSNNPHIHLIHLEAAGTNAIPLHISAAGAIAANFNKPVSFDGGSVPMILGTSQSNLVANLNADFLDGTHGTDLAARTHSHGNPTLALTNLAGTTASASNGLTISLSASTYLSTAAQVSHSHGNPTLALTNINGTTASASNGLTLSLSAVGGAGIAGIAGSAASTVTNGTLVFANLNGVSFGLNGSTMTASHNALTTAAQVSHSHGNPTLVLTNISGTTASASNGFTLSLSVNPPGGGGGIAGIADSASTVTNNSVVFANGTNITFSLNGSTMQVSAYRHMSIADSAGSLVTTGTLQFQNANGISFGFNGSTMTASHNALTTAAQVSHSHGNPTLALTNLTGTTASASNGFTLSLSGNAPGGGAAVTLSGFDPFSNAVWVLGGFSQSTLHVNPIAMPAAIAHDKIIIPFNFSAATNSTGSYSLSLELGMYTQNADSISRLSSTQLTFAWTHNGTNNSASNVGPHLISFSYQNTWPANNYWLALIHKTASAGANGSVSNFVHSQIASSISGFMNSASGINSHMPYGRGVYSAATAACPNNIAFSEIRGGSSAFRRQPIMAFASLQA